MKVWTPEDDADLLRRRKQGQSFAEIGRALDATKDSAQKRAQAIGGAVKRKVKVPDFDTDELAPLGIPAPPINHTLRAATDITLVGSDFHLGEDTRSAQCEEIFVDVARDLQPGVIVLNGDTCDLLAVSRFPKDYRTNNKLSVERRQFAELLYRLQEASPQSRIVETNANHSGDGVESRWSRYLSERIPEVMEDPELRDRWSYRNTFYPSWSDAELVDYVTVCPGLIAIHGDIVRSQAAYSAKAMLEKWRISLIHGHTHRIGLNGYRVPGIAEKKEHQMRAYEGGCMCKLAAPYLSMANWQQGFTIVRHDAEGHFGVEPVYIHEGTAIVNTTGTRYQAAA